jgi:hypothetical protein
MRAGAIALTERYAGWFRGSISNPVDGRICGRVFPILRAGLLLGLEKRFRFTLATNAL